MNHTTKNLLASILLCCVCTSCTLLSPPASSDNSITDNLQQQGNIDALSQDVVHTLIPTGNILSYSWQSAEEIAPDDLINICAYNNLLQLPVSPANSTIQNGGEYVTPHAPAPSVESAVQKMFSVSSEYLQTASLFNADDCTYTMLSGWGGGWGYKAMQCEIIDNQMHITIGCTFGENPPEQMGVLVVECSDANEIKYLSYTLTSETLPGGTVSKKG